MIKKIVHNNKEIETKHHKEMTLDMFEDLKDAYYSKPDKSLVTKELKGLGNGKSKITNITKYFFKDLMSKVILYHSKFSIEEVFECKELLEHFYSKVCSNTKVYPPTYPLIKNIETSFRLGGKGTAAKPSNFPIKTIDNILERYNVNNKYYDFSCGWGVRLMSALKNNVEYYGTDPNNILTERLNYLGKAFNKVNKTNRFYDIRTQGSEIFIADWENTIGIAFSSPPYFNLEDYRIGNQSWTADTNYESWLLNFMHPTIDNLIKYVIDGGYIMINIKNFDKYALYDDVFNICKAKGLEFIEVLTLSNIQRVNAKDNDEKIMVFRNRRM